MKAILVSSSLFLALVGLLVFTSARDSTANSSFASYGCVENTNCYRGR